MEIRQIMYFLSVAKYLNFTKASQECFVVQTTITHQIATLEKELGCKLFERTPRSVELTKYGQAFIPYAEKIWKAANESISELQYLKSHYESTFHVGYWGNLLADDLADILEEFKAVYPTTQIVLHQHNVKELLTMLENKSLDVIICCHFDSWEGYSWIKEEPILRDDLYFLTKVGHPLLALPELTVQDIQYEPLITFGGTNVTDLKQRCRQSGSDMNIILDLDDHQSIITLIEAGYGSTLASYHSISKANKALAYRRVKGELMNVQISAYWNSNGRKDWIEPFISIMKQHNY